MTRKRLSKEERQKEILEAGMKVFKKKGFVYSPIPIYLGEKEILLEA